MALPFVDTNLFLRHLTQDNAVQSPRATAYLQRIERGELQVTTAVAVIFAVVYVLQSTYKLPKAEIARSAPPVVEIPGIVLPGRSQLIRAFDVYLSSNLTYGDAFHVAVMEERGLTEMVSFDRGFDRIPGITRLDP